MNRSDDKLLSPGLREPSLCGREVDRDTAICTLLRDLGVREDKQSFPIRKRLVNLLDECALTGPSAAGLHTPFYFFYFRGMSAKEIADELGMRPFQVKKQIAKGRRLLKNELVRLCLGDPVQISFSPGFCTDRFSPFRDQSIDELAFSVRTYNCLKRAGIHTIGELADCDDEMLLSIRNLGKKGTQEIHSRLAELGMEPAGADTGSDEESDIDTVELINRLLAHFSEQ